MLPQEVQVQGLEHAVLSPPLDPLSCAFLAVHLPQVPHRIQLRQGVLPPAPVLPRGHMCAEAPPEPALLLLLLQPCWLRVVAVVHEGTNVSCMSCVVDMLQFFQGNIFCHAGKHQVGWHPAIACYKPCKTVKINVGFYMLQLQHAASPTWGHWQRRQPRGGACYFVWGIAVHGLDGVSAARSSNHRQPVSSGFQSLL